MAEEQVTLEERKREAIEAIQDKDVTAIHVVVFKRREKSTDQTTIECLRTNELAMILHDICVCHPETMVMVKGAMEREAAGTVNRET